MSSIPKLSVDVFLLMSDLFGSSLTLTLMYVLFCSVAVLMLFSILKLFV